MGGKENPRKAVVAQSVDVLDAMDLDAAVVPIDLDFAEMGILGGHPSQVLPHAADDGLDIARRFFGECAAKIVNGAPRDAEAGPDGARQPAAEGRRSVQGKGREDGVGRRRRCRLDGVQQGAAQLREKLKCVEHHRGRMGSRIGSRAVSSSHSRVIVKTRTVSFTVGGRRWASLAVVTNWASAARASSSRRARSAAR